MLGSRLIPLLKLNKFEVYTHSRLPRNNSSYACDLTEPLSVRSLLQAIKPDVVINLVAMTDVDRCEFEINKAYLLNSGVVANIRDAITSSDKHVRLIHISTDQLYDQGGLNLESSQSPSNIYGLTKLLGESFAQQVSSSVIRTNFVGKSACERRVSFTDWLHREASAGNVIYGFSDVFFSPLSMVSLSEIIVKIVHRDMQGVFNLGSQGPLSKADFAKRFLTAVGLDSKLVMCRSVDSCDLNLPAYRPKGMAMDCSKIMHSLNISLPNLDDEITLVAREYL